jgi:hypothetical protein
LPALGISVTVRLSGGKMTQLAQLPAGEAEESLVTTLGSSNAACAARRT